MKKSYVTLDTNLLMLVVLGRGDKELLRRHKGYEESSVIPLLEATEQIVKPFEKIATTPHVLAETSNLIGQIKNARKGKTLRAMRMLGGALDDFVELHTPASALSKGPAFPWLGLTDMSIVDLGFPIATMDGLLMDAAYRRGLEVFNPVHLIARD